MFDIIGDIHGCHDELELLLTTLKYVKKGNTYFSPEGRTLITAGDLCDRGPKSPAVFNLIQNMVNSGSAIAMLGNHEYKLLKVLNGKTSNISRGLQMTLNQLKSESTDLENLKDFIGSMPYRALLDENKLLICHAGLVEKYHFQPLSEKIRSKCIYGEVTGKLDECGYPERKSWQKDYSGNQIVVHGHIAVREPTKLNNIYNVDTGCVFGGKLTALRYPEMEFVSQPALKTYYRYSGKSF